MWGVGSLAPVHWEMQVFCFSLWGDPVYLSKRNRCIPRIMWQPPSSSYLRTLEALCCFLESVASFTSSDPSTWTPRHRYMLSNVLIVCHFRLSTLESLVYAVTCANILLSLGTLRHSAKLPTILLDKLSVSFSHNSPVSFPPLLTFFLLSHARSAIFPLPVMKMFPV